MAKTIHYVSLTILVLALFANPSSSLDENQLFNLVLTLKNPVCPSIVVVFDQLTWDEELEDLSEELFQLSYLNPTILLSSHQSVLQECGRNKSKWNLGAIACSNVIIFSRHPEELTRIHHQLMGCIYASQIFIVAEMAPNVADLWLKKMQSEIIVLILRERNKGLREIRHCMINNLTRHVTLPGINDVRLGEDKSLLRIVVVSCHQRKPSQVSDILKSKSLQHRQCSLSRFVNW